MADCRSSANQRNDKQRDYKQRTGRWILLVRDLGARLFFLAAVSAVSMAPVRLYAEETAQLSSPSGAQVSEAQESKAQNSERPTSETTPGSETPISKTPGFKTPGFKTPGFKTPGFKTQSSVVTIDEAQARVSVQWLADLAISKIPKKFDGDKHWGDTKKIWSGVKVRREGLKLKTNRRFREVEHGRWVKYEVELPKAGAGTNMLVHSVQPMVHPQTGDPSWQVHSSIIAPMKFTARIQRWNLGLKVFSLTVTGHMQIRLNSQTSIAFSADYSEIPPAFVVNPVVEKAGLVLQSFEVDRISNIGGEVAEQWGELIQEVLVERFVKKESERLAGRLNRSIDKERDDLRLSMADWFSKWQKPSVPQPAESSRD